MLNKFFGILLFLYLFGIQSGSAQSVAETYGTIPETWSAQISPDGAHLALGCSPTGVRAICIYEIDGASQPRLVLPPENGRIQSILWGSKHYLIYVMETFDRIPTADGLKSYNIRRMISYSLKSGKTTILLRNVGGFIDLTTIQSRLVDKPDKVQSAISFGTGASSYTGSRLNKVETATSYIIYEVDLKNGRAKPRKKYTGTTAGAVFNARGDQLALIEWNPKTKDYALISMIGEKTVVYEDADAALMPFYIAGLGENQQSLIVSFDNAERFGLYEISLLDGTITEVTYEGKHVGDVATFQDPLTNAVIGYRYTDHITEDFYLVEPFAKIASDARKALKADSIILTSWSSDLRLFTMRAINEGRPEQYFLYDVQTPSISPIGGEAPWLDSTPLGEVEPFSYIARDGMELEGYLTKPPGYNVSNGPIPLILLPHGGPEARDTADYDWLAQAIASQGYLVLQPNFRGSAGYGQSYRDAGYGEFGGKMILDIIDAAKWAKTQNLARDDKYCVIGGSYGGYAALMSYLHSPETVGCIVSINGVTNPGEFLSDYNRDGMAFEYWQQYMGDAYKTSDTARLAITPSDRAQEYTVPILLIHGREDTTVPVEQSRLMKRNLEKYTNVIYNEIKGDDHYLSSTQSRVDVLTATFEFLAAHHPVE